MIACGATIAALALSYRNQFNFATQHANYPVWLAWVFPLMIDSFVVSGEIRLFSATARREPLRIRLWAWFLTLSGLAVSVVFGVAHVDWSALGTAGPKLAAAVAPLAAAASLGTGLGLVKRRAQQPGVKGRQAAEPSEAVTAPTPRGRRVAAPPATRARPGDKGIELARQAVAAARAEGRTPPGRQTLATAYSISPHQARVILKVNGS
jgi:hypothetical protein